MARRFQMSTISARHFDTQTRDDQRERAKPVRTLPEPAPAPAPAPAPKRVPKIVVKVQDPFAASTARKADPFEARANARRRANQTPAARQPKSMSRNEEAALRAVLREVLARDEAER